MYRVEILRQMLREVVIEHITKIDSHCKSAEGELRVTMHVPSVFEPAAPVEIERIELYCYALIEEGRRREYIGTDAAQKLFSDLCKWHSEIEKELAQ